MPRLEPTRPEAHHAGWRHLAGRLLLAAVLFLFMSLNLPGGNVFALVPVTLLLWVGMLAASSASQLLDVWGPMRPAWVALTAGAYLAMALPALVRGGTSMVDALPAVATLTLLPHLGRRDLGPAVHDWAVVMGVALFAALGAQAMWVLVGSFGLTVFFIVAVMPPLLFEALMLLLGRTRATSRRRYIAPLVISTMITVALVGFTQFNRSTVPGWAIFFGIIVGVLIGAGLMLSHLTRRMAEAAAGSHGNAHPLARSFVELSHGPVIISLALYLPVSLLR